jgi:hypothetical protein
MQKKPETLVGLAVQAFLAAPSKGFIDSTESEICRFLYSRTRQ